MQQGRYDTDLQPWGKISFERFRITKPLAPRTLVREF